MDTAKGIPCHECAPSAWRHTPVLSGSFELDKTIAASANPDVASRMKFQVGGCATQSPFGPRTGYNGYSGYSGDV